MRRGPSPALRERVASVARRVRVLPRSKFSPGIVRAARWLSLPSCGRGLCDREICSSSPALHCGGASGARAEYCALDARFRGHDDNAGLRTLISETECYLIAVAVPAMVVPG